jgi:hypothetical protein
MFNKDVIELAKLVPIGTIVKIIWLFCFIYFNLELFWLRAVPILTKLK